MDAIKAKLAVWSKDKGLVKLASAIAALLLILLVLCCISIYMRSNIQQEYSTTIAQLQEQAYQNLEAMTELFSRIDDPNVDVRYKLIPELKAQYSAASAINSVLLTCAKEHALLSQEQIDAFDAAFELYSKSYRQGSATGLAKADMAACMDDVFAMVAQHNAPEEEEEDDVIIINASSGKIEDSSSRKTDS